MALPAMHFLKGGAQGSQIIDVDATNYDDAHTQLSKSIFCSEFASDEGFTMSWWMKPETFSTTTGFQSFVLFADNFEGPNPPSDRTGYSFNNISIQYNSSGQARLVIEIGDGFGDSDGDGQSQGLAFTGTFGDLNPGAWNHCIFTVVDGGTSSTNNRVFVNGDTIGAPMSNSIEQHADQSSVSLIQRQHTFQSVSPLEVCFAEIFADNKFYALRGNTAVMHQFNKGQRPVQPPSSKIYLRSITDSGGTHTLDNYGSESITVTNSGISACANSPSD